MDTIDQRLNDEGKNWRHVLKALKVLYYCLLEGSEMFEAWARKNIYIIKSLEEFHYMDENGKDVGVDIRAAAREMVLWILNKERAQQAQIHENQLEEEELWQDWLVEAEEFRQQRRLLQAAPARQHGIQEAEISTLTQLPGSSTRAELPESATRLELPGSSTRAELPDSSTRAELPG